MDTLKKLSDALFGGDVKAAQALLVDTEKIDGQRTGPVTGRSEISAWAADEIAWASGLRAQPTVVSSLSSEKRAVLELSLDITSDGETVDLPFVFVADRVGDGIAALRTYHSTWPYTGTHRFRKPPLEGDAVDPIPAVFTRYIGQVSNAEIEAVLATFTEDGYVREPSGNRWKHQGPEGRSSFYGHLESAPRATFELHTCVEEGPLIAVEYAFSYGDVPMVGGICVMEHEDGRIAAVRIADDVSA